MTGHTFNIAEAAARAGVSADTVRYYERIGVVPKPPRTDAGYRRYSDASVARIRFVRNAARFGFPLKELAGFLQARAAGRLPCQSVRAAGQRLLGEMDRQLADLTSTRAEMAATLIAWDAQLAAAPPNQPAFLLDSLKSGSGSLRLRSGPRAAPTRRPSNGRPRRAAGE